MKLILFTLLAALSTPVLARASGQQDFWMISKTTRPIHIAARDVQMTEIEPAMDHYACEEVFRMKDLGIFNETVALRSEQLDTPCEQRTTDIDAQITFILYKETTEEEGRGDGTLYCLTQVETRGGNPSVLLSNTYWKPKDSSACK